MNPVWLKALALVCVFGAVVLIAETALRWFASTRSEGKAINLRLKMISKGRSHGEAMNLLRRAGSAIPGSTFILSAKDRIDFGGIIPPK